MRTLYIKNVGPITQGTKINLKRFNVFIGPQSSGKSTIAKLVSTLIWLEKEACTSFSTDVLPEGVSFKKFIEDFHRMHGYINEETSLIRYESDYVSVKYEKGKFTLIQKDNNHYHRVKVSYVPADRNIVTMKDIEKRDLEPTNFRSFLFDWLECNKNYDMEHKMDILGLGVNYYFDKDAKEKNDKIIHDNGITYDIPLYDASSGLQSVVPLVVLMNYLTSEYFVNYNKSTSFETEQKKKELLVKLVRKYSKVVDYNEFDVFKEIASGAKSGDRVTLDKIGQHFKNLTIPDRIAFIIEEPEQNLFTQTQIDILYTIFSDCNRNEFNSSIITTHSPYILAAINILLLAGRLRGMGVRDEVLGKIVPLDSIVPVDDVLVYSVGNGSCHSIINAQTGLVDQNELDVASDYNAVVFDKLYKLFIQKLRE